MSAFLKEAGRELVPADMKAAAPKTTAENIERFEKAFAALPKTGTPHYDAFAKYIPIAKTAFKSWNPLELKAKSEEANGVLVRELGDTCVPEKIDPKDVSLFNAYHDYLEGYRTLKFSAYEKAGMQASNRDVRAEMVKRISSVEAVITAAAATPAPATLAS